MTSPPRLYRPPLTAEEGKAAMRFIAYAATAGVGLSTPKELEPYMDLAVSAIAKIRATLAGDPMFEERER